MYLFWKLTKAEVNYSNIEKKAVVIVWSTERAQQFLLGGKFLLKSDHQSFEFIFKPRKELPKVTLARILRWAIKLMAFDFDIVYVKGSTIPHVDALSRLNFVNKQKEINEDREKILHWVEADALSVEHLKEEILQDPVLSKISDRIKKKLIEELFTSRKTLQGGET